MRKVKRYKERREEERSRGQRGLKRISQLKIKIDRLKLYR